MQQSAPAHVPPKGIPLGIFASLVGCNLIWSAHPAMGKILLSVFTPAQSACIRYGSGLVAYVAAVALLRWLKPSSAGLQPILRTPLFAKPSDIRELLLFVLLGFMTFCFAPVLGMTGLTGTKATNGALLIAMEPLITVLLGWIFLREGITRVHVLSFALAIWGFGLLAGLTWHELTHQWSGELIANVIILISLTGEGAYSVLGRKLMARHQPMSVFGSALLAGVACLFIALALVPPQSLSTQAVAPASTGELWLAILWLGPAGTALSYLIWMVALRKARVATLTLTLFIQPVFGSIWGIVFLGERLDSRQAIGAFMILAAVGAQVSVEWLANRRLEKS